MSSRMVAAGALFAIVMTASASQANAARGSVHRGPWPISHWHQLQPRADQLRALGVNDLTRQEARKVDELYRELEGPARPVRRAVMPSGRLPAVMARVRSAP